MKSRIQNAASQVKPSVKTPGKQTPKQPSGLKPLNVRLLYAVIAALAFILYGNTIPNNYSLDDSYVTSVNPVVQQGIKAIPQIFSSNYISMNAEEGGQHNYGYRPVAKATYAIEWQFFGENPHVSHFINVLLYALTGILLLSLLRRLFKGYNIILPFLAVLFFMVHPVHTEVVASLKNREELLSFLGALMTIHFFLRWYESGKKMNILWALVSFALGYMSKVNIFTFVFIIPLIFYFFTDIRPRKIIISTLLVVGVLVLIVMIPRFIIGTAVRPIQFIENPLQFDPTFAERIGTSMIVLLHYLKMLVFPHPLVFYYGYDMIPISTFSNPMVWLSLLIHLALFGYAIFTIKKKSLLSFAILFYLINIGIFSNLVAPPTGIVADRFMYVASLGFALALAWLLFKIFKADPSMQKIPSRALTYIILITLLIGIPASARTIDRNRDWKTEMTLYEADMPYMERSAKGNFIYATNLRSIIIERLKSGTPRKEIVDEANTCIEHFKRAVSIYPEYPDAWNNLGETFLLLLNESDSSIKYFEKAVQVNPQLHSAFYNLGYTYQVTGQYEKSIENYEKALEIEPWEIRTMSNLAQMYEKIGNVDKAISLNEDIIKMDPTLDVPYINLAAFALHRGDNATAIGYFEKALEVNPKNMNLSLRLRDYYQKLGDSTKADYYLELARKAQQ
ncbi:MAG TPA: tetratricopeptide repeat protein [Lentimicrobium sp.]|nr:tetratricopeptide repeat protein [Lentimicrobium sp.]